MILLHCNFDLCVDKHNSLCMISIHAGKALLLISFKNKACIDVTNLDTMIKLYTNHQLLGRVYLPLT